MRIALCSRLSMVSMRYEPLSSILPLQHHWDLTVSSACLSLYPGDERLRKLAAGPERSLEQQLLP
jgi:hypothetical protein